MDAPLFYTGFAEIAKVLFYGILMLFVLYGLYEKIVRKSGHWANWIHAAILGHFLVGALYSGIRMVLMNPFDHMMIRRFFAWEAWFNFACAAFYFVLILFLSIYEEKCTG